MEWIGREGLSPETHEDYLMEFINHFYKNVLRLVDRAMKKEDTSEQGRIVSELMQHLHSCKNNCDVFFGRAEELDLMKEYIMGESNKPFVMYGAGGSGNTNNCISLYHFSFISSIPINREVLHAEHDSLQGSQ